MPLFFLLLLPLFVFLPLLRSPQSQPAKTLTPAKQAPHYWALNLEPFEAIATVIDTEGLPTPDMVQVYWQGSFWRARSLAPGYTYTVNECVHVLCGQNNHLWIEPQPMG
jgi:hypothetical protein